MSHPPRTDLPRVRRLALVLLVVGLLAAQLGTPATSPASAGPAEERSGHRVQRPQLAPGRYVVLLRKPGAAAYDGGVRGLARTRSDDGVRFEPRSRAVRRYVAHLHEQQDRLARSVGARVERRFGVVTNGFTARLTGRQALALAGRPDVLAVAREQRRSLDTWSTPRRLGLTGPDGAWRRGAGSAAAAGRGVVVGVLDSGIWPESRSFRGRPLGARPKTRWRITREGEVVTMRKADGGLFEGRCQLGHEEGGNQVAAERWRADDCTTKMIAARYYPEEFVATVPPENRSPVEVLSARDGNGHGSHTAGTAAGKPVPDVRVDGVRFGRVSGMAPGAKLATYKVCFDDDDPDTGDCFDSSILAAIEDAVVDGVDVINFSISGATDTVVDVVELAFEGAAEAGVFVAASAGNSGPGESTVGHNSPWLTTVAATSHHRFENTVELGNGRRLRGASLAQQPLPQTRLVDARDATARGARAGEARLCLPGSLAARAVRDAVVVCARGTNARVEKSAVVAQAGGVGMLLVNVEPGSLDADFHAVPTVHLSHEDAPALFGYLRRAGRGATAALLLGDRTGRPATPMPQVAGFSARGPALANGGDLLKPDLAAPGVSILAAVAPPSNEGRRFDMYSGTSMAAPHVAGLAAFVMAARPGWSPMKVKSAMMTTARSVRTATGRRERDPFAQGAGLVRPRRFLDPGLFVVSTPLEWRRYTQGQGVDWGQGYRPLAPRRLNVPSLAQGQVTSRTTFTREFLAARAGTWRVRVEVPGFAVRAPDRLVAERRGDRVELRIRFRRTTAKLGRFATGAVVLDGPTRVRLPVALRPVSVLAPAEVAGAGVSGSVEVPVTAGGGGRLDIRPTGLVAALTETGTATEVTPGFEDEVYFCFQVDDGSRAARFDLHTLDDGADADLLVVPVDDTCSEQAGPESVSATDSGDERVTLLDPAPGWYVAAVDPFAPAEGRDTLAWRLDFFDVDAAFEEGRFVAQPDPLRVSEGRRTAFTASWSGLTADTRYLGTLDYDGALSPTFVSVDTGAAAAASAGLRRSSQAR